MNIKHDISIPVSRIPAFVAETDALLAREIAGVRLVNFGHLGDGNLHYNVQAPENVDTKAFLKNEEDRINTLVYEAVEKFGGSFSAEHGVGSLKVDTLEAQVAGGARDDARNQARAGSEEHPESGAGDSGLNGRLSARSRRAATRSPARAACGRPRGPRPRGSASSSCELAPLRATSVSSAASQCR